MVAIAMPMAGLLGRTIIEFTSRGWAALALIPMGQLAFSKECSMCVTKLMARQLLITQKL
jgi:hypothetical protein